MQDLIDIKRNIASGMEVEELADLLGITVVDLLNIPFIESRLLENIDQFVDYYEEHTEEDDHSEGC